MPSPDTGPPLHPRKNQVAPTPPEPQQPALHADAAPTRSQDQTPADDDRRPESPSSSTSSITAAAPPAKRASRGARPLASAGPDDFLSDNVSSSSSYRGHQSERTFHLFVNDTAADVELFWYYDGGDFSHGIIPINNNLYVGTYTYHQWRLQDAEGKVLGLYAGPSATVVVHADLQLEVTLNPSKEDTAAGTPVVTASGTYSRRSVASGIGIWAFDCVEDAAVRRAEHVIGKMLALCPEELRVGLVTAGAALGIVGRDQVVSDLPPHAFMRHNRDRNLDKTARGLGATPHIPVTSVGEENLTMTDDPLFSCQSILVHEMGHCLMNLAFDQLRLARVSALFREARATVLYPPEIYCMCNEQEYWACGVEAWFEATVRVDVNAGVNTRDKLRAHNPGLAALIAEVFGDGPWRYQDDSPLPLMMHRKHAAKAASAAAAAAAAAAASAAASATDASLPISTPPSDIEAPSRGDTPMSLAFAVEPPTSTVFAGAGASGASAFACLGGGFASIFASCMPHGGKRRREERTKE